MKTVEVEITGITPYLMNRFPDEDPEKETKRIKAEDRTPREIAEKKANIDQETGCLYFNAPSIPGTMSNAGVNHKKKGSRKSLKYVIPGAVRTDTDRIFLLDENGKPTKTFEIDSRPVVNPTTRGRRICHRPRFDRWKARFILFINDNLISVETVHMLLTEAGETIGIGDYRPSKGGPFGTFRVTEFKEV